MTIPKSLSWFRRTPMPQLILIVESSWTSLSLKIEDFRVIFAPKCLSENFTHQVFRYKSWLKWLPTPVRGYWITNKAKFISEILMFFIFGGKTTENLKFSDKKKYMKKPKLLNWYHMWGFSGISSMGCTKLVKCSNYLQSVVYFTVNVQHLAEN